MSAQSSILNPVLLTIEKLVYGGDGLARLVPDASGRSKAAFVPFVLEGERVEAEVTEERPGFVRAQATSIVETSAARVAPPCPLFGQCGGCHYQHATYEHQLAAKRAILLETLRRTAKLELPCELETVSAEPWQFRNRARLKVRTQGEFAIGYHGFGSHELLPVRECPISSPLVNRAIAVCWDLAETFHGVPELREVQLFANHDDTRLLIELYVEQKFDAASIEKLTKALLSALPAEGVAVLNHTGSQEESAAKKVLCTFGPGSLTCRVGEFEYRVSAGAFFQTNRFLVERMVELVCAPYAGRSALDLYAGVGLFSLPLRRAFAEVSAVEASPISAADLRANCAQHGIRAVEGATEPFLTRSGGRYDLVVVDPPRAGLGERIVRALARLHSPRIIYVSCDPSTLSRDLRLLLELGFRAERAQLVDLFPQTFHMESIFHLAR